MPNVVTDERRMKPTREQLAALRRAQRIARKYIPEGVSLSEELMRERRDAASNG